MLPTPIKCPFTDSCNGGIESSCTEEYEGTLSATCSSNLFLSFNRCLECPSMLVRVTSCVFLSGTASSVACSSCVYGKILEVCRGEQFAPLSHINPVFRLDPFIQFFLSISFNISVILLILMYLLLKRQYIRKLKILECQKIG